jgi:NADPH-ferrihemoprotein reductase
MASPFDLLILFLTIALPLAYYFRDSIPGIGAKTATVEATSNGHAPKKREEEGDPRDFVGKMERAVRFRLWSGSVQADM